MRPRDDLHADDLADAAGRRGAGVDGRLDRGHVADDQGRHQAAADLLPADQRHVRRLQHGVARLDQRPPAPWSRSCQGLPGDCQPFKHSLSVWFALARTRVVSRLGRGVNSSTSVALGRSQALPSSVSRWTSSLAPRATRQSSSSSTAEQLLGYPQVQPVAVLDAVVGGVAPAPCGRAARGGSRRAPARSCPPAPAGSSPASRGGRRSCAPARRGPAEMASVNASSTWL